MEKQNHSRLSSCQREVRKTSVSNSYLDCTCKAILYFINDTIRNNFIKQEYEPIIISTLDDTKFHVSKYGFYIFDRCILKFNPIIIDKIAVLAILYHHLRKVPDYKVRFRTIQNGELHLVISYEEKKG